MKLRNVDTSEYRQSANGHDIIVTVRTISNTYCTTITACLINTE